MGAWLTMFTHVNTVVFHGYIMTVTWFSDGQPSYNTMVDIDTNMFNHVSTLFTTAGLGS